MRDFAACLAVVLPLEGGYVNDPDDPGGATNFGVTQSVFTTWLAKHGLPNKAVKDITMSEVSGVYEENYWRLVGGDALPDPVNLVVFDAAVNQGVGYAPKLLQWAVGAKQDGVVGPGTIALVKSQCATVLARDLLWGRNSRYLATCRLWKQKGKPDPYKYMDGWYRRLDTLWILLR